MKFGPAKHFVALLLAAPLRTGCLERGQPTMVDSSADDDAFWNHFWRAKMLQLSRD